MSRKSPCDRIAHNWIFCLFVCFVFWILSYPEKCGQGEFWHLVIKRLLKVWIITVRDRIENVVGKYWVRVHGVDYGYSDIVHSWLCLPTVRREEACQKRIFRLRTSWLPRSSGMKSHFQVRVIVLVKTSYFLFPKTFTRVSWWFVLGKHKMSGKDMQGPVQADMF